MDIQININFEQINKERRETNVLVKNAQKQLNFIKLMKE